MEASDTHPHLGRARDYQELEDFNSSDDYDEQDETRTVKHLLFTYHVIAPSPMIPGQEIIMEKNARRGEVIYLDELGTYYQAFGERHGAFFTDDELAEYERAGVDPASLAELPPGQGQIEAAEGEGVNFKEMGSDEMAEYLEENQPNVDETLALVEGDADAARRLLDAENIVTNNDPRAGVEKGVERIIASA